MKRSGGPERVVALFDVAGGDLARLGRDQGIPLDRQRAVFRRSIRIAERRGRAERRDLQQRARRGEETRSRSGPVSAAIVLNKADPVRFEEPVDRWLRSEGAAPSGGALTRWSSSARAPMSMPTWSARKALAMTEPYEVCHKATMHVASPTGGAETAGRR